MNKLMIMAFLGLMLMGMLMVMPAMAAGGDPVYVPTGDLLYIQCNYHGDQCFPVYQESPLEITGGAGGTTTVNVAAPTVNIDNDFLPYNNVDVDNTFAPENNFAPTTNVAAPTVNVAAPTVNIDNDFAPENNFAPVNDVDIAPSVNNFAPVNNVAAPIVNIDNDFAPVNNIDNDFAPVNNFAPTTNVAAPTVNVAAPTVNVAAPTVNVAPAVNNIDNDVHNDFAPVNNVHNDFAPVNDVDVHNDFAPVNNVDVDVAPAVNNVHNDFAPVNDVDVHTVNDVDVHNDFAPTVNVAAPLVDNHITVQSATPDINVDQDQSQRQSQNQNQIQLQGQTQSQSNVQTVNVPAPVINVASPTVNIVTPPKEPITAQLEVGEARVESRLVYPGEVLLYPVKNGDIIAMRSASDVGLYTIGLFCEDALKVGSIESTPKYDPVYHKLEFGTVVPINKIDFWTTKATLVASAGVTNVVIDNRAPKNGYTHVEITITSGTPAATKSSPEKKAIPRPDVYPTDEYGRVITS